MLAALELKFDELRDALAQYISSTKQLAVEGSLADALEASVAVLSSLPHHACPTLVMITDGAATAPDMSAYEALTAAMGRTDVNCVMLLARSAVAAPRFGCVPDADMLAVTAAALNGTVLDAEQVDARQLHSHVLARPALRGTSLRRRRHRASSRC